jgi:hypothetical protein
MIYCKISVNVTMYPYYNNNMIVEKEKVEKRGKENTVKLDRDKNQLTYMAAHSELYQNL